MSESLVGVVLMGGYSTRMGQDKAELTVANGQKESTFAELAHEKLKCYTTDVYYSINVTQKEYFSSNVIVDKYDNEGPLSGIISSLEFTQNSILVLGVDLPLIGKKTIKNLIANRNWDLLTTTYYNFQDTKWQPMVSIWEIETLPCLKKFFEEGGRSVQKFLDKFGNQKVEIQDISEFQNINTPEDYQNLLSH